MKCRFRLLAGLSVIALLGTACASKSGTEAERTTGKYGSGVDLDVEQKRKPKQEQAEQQQDGSTAGTQQGPSSQGNSGSGGDGFEPDLSRKPIDGGSAGVNAFFFLNKQVPRLVIEVDAVSGHEPSASALNLLRQRLVGFVDKPGGVQLLPTEVIPQGRETWSESDAANAEARYRDTHNTREQASIYLLYVDGRPSRQGPIGIAYSGSSAIIYIQQIRGIATPLVTADGIEKATIIHEVGHLYALVNQTYKSPREHEDPEHRGHSKNQGSVMYWAVESISVVSLLGGKTDPPNTLDKDDLADLQDLKTGKLP